MTWLIYSIWSASSLFVSRIFYQKVNYNGDFLTNFPNSLPPLIPTTTPDGIFSSPEPKAHGELIVYQSSRRPCVRAFTLLNINISETSGPIATKFYLKHHWGGGKAASGFWPDRIGTLVSMATDSSHRVIMGKTLLAH